MGEKKRDNLRKRLRKLFDNIRVLPSPNFSSRRGSNVKATVIHTTEGSFESALSWLRNHRSQASSHYLLKDVPNNQGDEFVEVIELVPEDKKAWTALTANPVTNNIELAGYASRNRKQWLGPYRAQLRTAAALAAEDAHQYGLPVRHGFPGQLGHVDLAKYGFPQSHTDPGEGFPWDVFMKDVKKYYDMGTKLPKTKVNARGEPRPKGVPRVIPPWAWRLAKWHKSGRSFDRPKAPRRVPKWYWAWYRWRFGGAKHEQG